MNSKKLFEIINEEVEAFFAKEWNKEDYRRCSSPYCSNSFKIRHKNHLFCSNRCYRHMVTYLGSGHIMGKRKRKT